MLELIDHQIATLKIGLAEALGTHQPAVLRLAAVPGYGIDSAQQVMAEVGASAATFPTPQQLASWVGVCPGREESAERSKSNRTPKGNRMVRAALSQVANAAVKTKGSQFQILYRRLLPRLGHNKAVWAIAHRLCKLTWKILHQGVSYIEYGDRDPQRSDRYLARLTRQLRARGYTVIPPQPLPAIEV